MGALLVIALVVAIVRIVSSGKSDVPEGRENLKVNQSIKDFLAENEPDLVGDNAARREKVSDEEVLKGLMGREAPAKRQAPARPERNTGANNSGLSDVRRSLGLE